MINLSVIPELEAAIEDAKREEIAARKMALTLRRVGAPSKDIGYAEQREEAATVNKRRLLFQLQSIRGPS